MLVKDYQYITSLDTGNTIKFENDLVDYFKLDKSLTPEQISKEIDIKLKFKVNEVKKFIKINDKEFKVETDLLKCSFEQFSRLDILLSENNNIQNLHKLLAIYCRPVNFFNKIKKFNIQEQDEISEMLLNMDMNDAQGLLVFFFVSVTKCLRYMNISYLNRMKMNIPDHTKNK